MPNPDECVVTFLVVGGIFAVDRLASRLNELSDPDQLGPWHIGHWVDFKHTAIRIRFGTAADGKLPSHACINAGCHPHSL